MKNSFPLLCIGNDVFGIIWDNLMFLSKKQSDFNLFRFSEIQCFRYNISFSKAHFSQLNGVFRYEMGPRQAALRQAKIGLLTSGGFSLQSSRARKRAPDFAKQNQVLADGIQGASCSVAPLIMSKNKEV